jgi:hypothetical protein
MYNPAGHFHSHFHFSIYISYSIYFCLLRHTLLYQPRTGSGPDALIVCRRETSTHYENMYLLHSTTIVKQRGDFLGLVTTKVTKAMQCNNNGTRMNLCIINELTNSKKGGIWYACSHCEINFRIIPAVKNEPADDYYKHKFGTGYNIIYTYIERCTLFIYQSLNIRQVQLTTWNAHVW